VNEVVEKFGLTIGGEEYKRKKPCNVPEAEQFFLKKGLSLSKKTGAGDVLFSHKIAEEAVEVFEGLREINDYFHEIVEINDLAKALEKEAEITAEPEPEIKMIKAPEVDFMW
ncbi:MAG: hypothetical protein J6M07_07135, partial [Ruminococcus sp.]|nr:hypothetical protein [Ruminococcus sp.]